MTYIVLMLIGFFATNWLIKAWFDTTTHILRKNKNTNQIEDKPLWTAMDDLRERDLYLANPAAFWLNPNRYDQDGKMDLLADPYQPKPSSKNRLGNWTYYTASTATTSSHKYISMSDSTKIHDYKSKKAHHDPC